MKYDLRPMIAGVMLEYPDLSPEGFKRKSKWRGEMLKPDFVRQVDCCIKAYPLINKKTQGSAYHIKHLVEQVNGNRYISTASVIVAMIILGHKPIARRSYYCNFSRQVER